MDASRALAVIACLMVSSNALAQPPGDDVVHPRPPYGIFEVECRFGISGCESQASEKCGYAGYHLIDSYKVRGAFGSPYYYVKAACGPEPAAAGKRQAAPTTGSPPSASTIPGDPDASGVFEVECRFGISGCESQASEKCGYAGYRVVDSYKTRGAFGSPYYYMKAACGPGPTPAPSTAAGVGPERNATRTPATVGTMRAANASDIPRLEMPVPGASPPQRDPFDKPSATTAERAEQLETTANAGNVQAQTRLGQKYAFGDGVSKNTAIAAEWYRRAAEQGDATAQNNLAVLYDKGEGIPRDMARAASWYQKAADQGAAVAQHNLAVLYRIGLGVPKDDERAAESLKMAAKQGLANAQTLLGVLYASGEGVSKDEVLAYAWFNLAAAQGDDGAATARDELRLSAERVAEAQRLSSAWKLGKVLRHPSTQTKDRPRAGH